MFFNVIILKFDDNFSKEAICVIPSTLCSCQNHYQGNLYAVFKLNFFLVIKLNYYFIFIFITKVKLVFITKVIAQR